MTFKTYCTKLFTALHIPDKAGLHRYMKFYYQYKLYTLIQQYTSNMEEGVSPMYVASKTVSRFSQNLGLCFIYEVKSSITSIIVPYYITQY